MSNTARKARKRQNKSMRDLANSDTMYENLRPAPYQHPVKVGTPLADRHVPQVMSKVNGILQPHLSGNAIMRKFRRAKVTGEQVFNNEKAGA